MKNEQNGIHGEVAEKAEISEAEAKNTVEAALDTVTDPGFGVFSTRETSARAGRNPATGESINCGARLGRAEGGNPAEVCAEHVTARRVD
ncbi:HU family DNA-binding protein [Salinisphaera sp. RV14]|uniref:HU family DNA-binding protein n=1 Tax=unclassified Salinisphaera TaxID=2649847 RepID=UPI003F86AA0E